MSLLFFLCLGGTTGGDSSPEELGTGLLTVGTLGIPGGTPGLVEATAFLVTLLAAGWLMIEDTGTFLLLLLVATLALFAEDILLKIFID